MVPAQFGRVRSGRRGRAVVTQEEKRRAERISTPLPVHIGDAIGITRDVSATGVFFETETPFSIGTSISFEVQFATPSGGLVLRCRGDIVRVETRERCVGVAVRIVDSAVEPAKTIAA